MSNARIPALIAAFSTLALAACGRMEAQGPQSGGPVPAPQGDRTLRDAATLSVFIDLAPGAALTSPVRITGTADHRFFNEGVFPIRLRGANGCLLGEAPALPAGDWTAPGQVAFEASLAFDAAPGSSAVLVFEQDVAGENPLPPLEVRTLVKVAGTLAADRADPDPEDCQDGAADHARPVPGG